MPGPCIFVATNKLKEGKLEDEKRRVPELSDFVEANEPRLIALHEYADESGSEVAVVQVHPDALVRFSARGKTSGHEGFIARGEMFMLDQEAEALEAVGLAE